MAFHTGSSQCIASNQFLAIYTNLSGGYFMVMIKIYKTELNAKLDTNLIARSFKYCGVTTNNFADYGSQLRHFITHVSFSMI
jgi:hypothetical protein